MRTMNSKEMMEANGGKYRYQCVECGKKCRTWVAVVGHVLSNGIDHIRFRCL